MTNYNRMTIRQFGESFQVFKMKPNHKHAGSVSGGGYKLTTWTVSAIAKARYTGTYSSCMSYISENGAVFMTEHGIPC